MSVSAKNIARSFIRTLIGSLIILIGETSLFAQTNIIQAEYFIDTDPGVGSGTAIGISSGPAIDETFSALTSALPSGYHYLYVRALDQNGVWSFVEKRPFFISPPGTTTPPVIPDIISLEYYIDNDPGTGLATMIDVTDDLSADINDMALTSVLSEGYHVLGVRALTENGDWGFHEKRVFFIRNAGSVGPPVILNVVAIEYYFDNDPGIGLATDVASFGSGLSIDLNELLIDAQVLTPGIHVLSVRAQYEDGNWGFMEKRPVLITQTNTSGGVPDIVKIEYYFDGDDPGVGIATELPITSGQILEYNTIDIPTSPSLIDGPHTITFRAQNALGGWGVSEQSDFDVLDDCIQPMADFSPQLACAGEAVQFLDASTNLQPDAQYRWYFNGDNLADDFTTGTTSFTFTNPGTYNIGLAISQGTICYDSIGYQITIKPKPVALFTPSGFVEGSPTNFTTASSNVDPGATWEWDFENDAVVDDNTAGNTSFTYPSSAIYTASLRVTDNLGCETGFSSGFTIQPVGGGGGLPAVDFVASLDCEGETTVFTDLSKNIPPGAIYSWDFDNDGVEDDNSTGSTLFAYSTSGEYTSKLSVDLGGGTILNTSQLVKITKVPTVDFSILSACTGEVVSFTDLSADLEEGATYKWDFENDGIVDDNTTGDNIHTYQTPGTYLVSLEINNGSGCKIKTTRQLVIDPVPVAGFSYSGSCAATDILFTSISQNLTTGSVIEWDFENDGIIESSGSGLSSYQFPAAGTYDVSLSIRQPKGCIDTYVESIEIVEFPVPDFTFSKGCISTEWSFQDLSQNINPAAVYSWDFDGDGVEDSSTPGDQLFQFSSQGTYVISLSVDNGSGCIEVHKESVQVLADPVPNFTIVGGCVGDEIFILDKSTAVNSNAIYSWDFDGDGIEDSQFGGDVSFVFNSPGEYVFNLSIDNGNGCFVTKSQNIQLHGIPNPDFEVLSDCFGLPSRFVDHSQDVSSEAVYSWDFNGDGSEDDNTIGNTTFTFSEFKPYIATLTIDNGLGCINVTEVIVDFRDAAAPDFVAGSSCINVETVFTDHSSELETAAIYSWDFNGDGLEDSSVPGSTFYIYRRPGIYQASLTIYNAELCSSTRTVSVEVTQPPAIDLGMDVELCTEGTVTIDAGTGYTSYFWSDGSSDQSLTVDNFGEYWVSITDVKGCRNIDTVEVRLKDLPDASFEHTVIYSPVDGIIVNFENVSREADTWFWDFGDGQSSDEQSPIHIYADFSFFEDTPYTICLTATDRCGQVSTYCKEILLSPLLIDDPDFESVKIYPNPGTGLFTIEFEEMNLLNVIVTDQIGKIVKRFETFGSERGSFQIDLEGYSSGVYMILLLSEDQQIVRKVILEEK